MDKRQAKTEAAELIVKAVRFAALAGVNSAECGVALSTSLYLNIRDAMFHFKALCDNLDSDDEEWMKQYFSLKEHLARGEKDAVISHAQMIINKTLEIMEQLDFSKKFDLQETKQLQGIIRKVKTIILNVRIAGTDLAVDSTFSVEKAWRELIDCTLEINQLCKNKSVSLF